MKRITAIILVLVMAASLFAGCSKKSESKESTSGSSKAGTVNMYGWEVPEETLVIDYYGGQGDPNDYEKYGKQLQEYILEEFNVKLNKVVYDDDISERLNLMLTANDYPGVLTGLWYENIETMSDMGKLVDLSSMIKEYAPDLVEAMGDLLNRYYEEDGSLYILPAGWGYLPVGNYGSNVRLDWYKEVGSPEYTTPEEYTEVLKQMVANHPTNANGEKVYALGTSKDNRFYLDLAGTWGLTWGWKIDDDGNATSWINTDECVEAVKWVNSLVREGLFDPDSFIQTNEEWGAKMTNERYAGHLGTTWEPQSYGQQKWSQLYGDDWKEDMRYVAYDLHPSYIEHSMLNPVGSQGWSFTAITDKCENPEGVLKWVNFENTEIGIKLLGWGIPNLENSVWNYDGETWSYNEEVAQKVVDNTLDWEDFNSLGAYYYVLAPTNADLEDGTNGSIDTSLRYRNEWLKTRDENLSDTMYDFTINWSISFPADDPVTIKKTQANDIVTTGYVQAIMAASEEECVQKILETRDKANAAGMHDVEKYYSSEYKRISDQWGQSYDYYRTHK